MPRKRTTQDPPRKRSRTGCDKCRSRKVACDETKPACSQCQSKGFDCQTTIVLKWEADYLHVGKAFGRSGVYRKDASTRDTSLSPSSTIDGDAVPWQNIPPISDYSFVNANTKSIERLTTHWANIDKSLNTQVELSHDRTDASTTASLSPWLARCRSPLLQPSPAYLTALPQLKDSLHMDLLSYYINQLCPLTIPGSIDKSPFASLLLPFSMTSSPAVLDSVLALSACHRSKSNATFKPMALQLGDKVLRKLRFRLSTEDSYAVAMDPETLVIMMVLCQYEIINECDKRWTVHLKGARDLIRLRRQAPMPTQLTPSVIDLVAFTEKFFAYQDVMGRTACGEQPLFGSDFWAAQRDETDPWLGCSPALVSAICEITELSWQRRENAQSSLHPDFQRHARSLKARLANLEQRVFEEEDYLLQTCAELKRNAAELYLECAVNGASPTTPLVSSSIQQMLRSLSILLEHDITAGLSWPIFVLAVQLDPLEDHERACAKECGQKMPVYARPFVLYALDRMNASTANIMRTRAVIEKVWQTREFNQLSSMHRSESVQHCNDWERLVAPFCGTMSLA